MSSPVVESVSAGGTKVLGLLADPGAPAELAYELANDLVEVTGDQRGGGGRWRPGC